MSDDNAQLDRILTALANKKRRAIVHRLSLQPASITELAKEGKLSLPAIHKHIRILEQAGLIQRRKSGRTNFLALNPTVLQILRDWIAGYHSYFGNGQETLENYVEGIEKKE